MRALCVSDKVVSHLYDAAVRTRVGEIDLILGCGDLPYYYLEYLLTTLNVPLLYVHGNHDPEMEYTPNGEAIYGPGGGFNMDQRVIEMDGLIFAGLQGSIRYKPEGIFQHTQSQMWMKVFRLVPRLLYNQMTKGRALDVLITHSPPMNIHNGNDHVHQGFNAFLWLMEKFKPRYLIHGHHHVYRRDEQTVTPYHDTIVNNIYPYKVLEFASIPLSPNESPDSSGLNSETRLK